MQKKGQCRDIKFPVSRHYMKKVLTLLQCPDIAATSVEEKKAKICQCRDIITTLRRHQVNVTTTQLNVATSKVAPSVKLKHSSNVATLDMTTTLPVVRRTEFLKCCDITTTSWRHQNKPHLAKTSIECCCDINYNIGR